MNINIINNNFMGMVLIKGLVSKEKGKKKEKEKGKEKVDIDDKYNLNTAELRRRRLEYLIRRPNIKCYDSTSTSLSSSSSSTSLSSSSSSTSLSSSSSSTLASLSLKSKPKKLTKEEIEEKQEKIEKVENLVKKHFHEKRPVMYYDSNSGECLNAVIVKNFSGGTIGTSDRTIIEPYIHLRLKFEKDENYLDLFSLKGVRLIKE